MPDTILYTDRLCPPLHKLPDQTARCRLSSPPAAHRPHSVHSHRTRTFLPAHHRLPLRSKTVFPESNRDNIFRPAPAHSPVHRDTSFRPCFRDRRCVSISRPHISNLTDHPRELTSRHNHSYRTLSRRTCHETHKGTPCLRKVSALRREYIPSSAEKDLQPVASPFITFRFPCLLSIEKITISIPAALLPCKRKVFRADAHILFQSNAFFVLFSQFLCYTVK